MHVTRMVLFYRFKKTFVSNYYPIPLTGYIHRLTFPAKEEVVTRDLNSIQRALAAIHEAVQLFHHDPTMPATIAREFALAPADAAEWYAAVRIAAERFISEAAVTQARDALVSAAVLPASAPTTPSSYIDARLAELRRDIKCIGLYHRPELVCRLSSLERTWLISVQCSKLLSVDVLLVLVFDHCSCQRCTATSRMQA